MSGKGIPGKSTCSEQQLKLSSCIWLTLLDPYKAGGGPTWWLLYPYATQHSKINNQILYGNLSRISNTIRSRRLKLSGHCYRDKSSLAHKLITWIPQYETTKPGHPLLTYVDTLMRNTSSESIHELKTLMSDSDHWRCLNRLASSSSGLDKK